MASLFSISELEVLHAITKGSKLPKKGRSEYGSGYKRHIKAIETLKDSYVIYKDEKNILQIEPAWIRIVNRELLRRELK